MGGLSAHPAATGALAALDAAVSRMTASTGDEEDPKPCRKRPVPMEEEAAKEDTSKRPRKLPLVCTNAIRNNLTEADPSLPLFMLQDHAQRGGKFSSKLFMWAEDLGKSTSVHAICAMHDALTTMLPSMDIENVLNQDFFTRILHAALVGVADKHGVALKGSVAQLSVAVAALERARPERLEEILNGSQRVGDKEAPEGIIDGACDIWRRFAVKATAKDTEDDTPFLACETACDLVRVVTEALGVDSVRKLLKTAGARKLPHWIGLQMCTQVLDFRGSFAKGKL